MIPRRLDRLPWSRWHWLVVIARLAARHPSEERELVRLRRRETLLALIATAIAHATAIIVIISLASLVLSPAATLGGSAFLGIAGGLIAFERWYGVGDFVMVEPSKAAGVVDMFGLRTTVTRQLNGDPAYVPNSQIITAFRSPKGYGATASRSS